MSAFDSVLDLREQICYVQCAICSTILLVNVPFSSLSLVVTVRCGHCTGILSVNMTEACLVPVHLFSSSNQQEEMVQPNWKACSGEVVAEKQVVKTCPPLCFSSDEDDAEDSIHFNQVIHKPPEKKHRTPSAYNHFIKDEIKRLKTEYPRMTHKQAFSAAAKNWAHCPQSQCKGGEGDGRIEEDTKPAKHLDIHNERCNETPDASFWVHEAKGLRQSTPPKTPIY